jgi:hypothetical protein
MFQNVWVLAHVEDMGVEISNLSSEVPNSLWLLRKSSLTKTQTKSNVSVVAVNKCYGFRCFDTRNVSLKKVKKIHVYAQLFGNPKKGRPLFVFGHPISQLLAFFSPHEENLTNATFFTHHILMGLLALFITRPTTTFPTHY